jgi:glycine/D-amino acid oxidase-like deaminating enzyme
MTIRPDDSPLHPWGSPPWAIDFSPRRFPPRVLPNTVPHTLPNNVDVAVIGAGFTGLAAAAWLRLHAPDKSVAVLEAGRIGEGASGRTGGMALAETAVGDLPGLGDVLAGLQDILARLEVECSLTLPGAWEIGRTAGLSDSPISWNDSGTLRVLREVPGGTLDPGELVSGLARSAHRQGATIFESHRVTRVRWATRAELEIAPRDSPGNLERMSAGQVLFATNALSLPMSGLDSNTHPKLTLAALTAPVSSEVIQAIGLSDRKPFYTVDFPYLWGRLRRDNSIVWGAGLADPDPSGSLQKVRTDSGEPARMFASLEKRVRGLHPALVSATFTHRWGGPILFRDNWKPVFDRHPESENALVIGAFAGHGVALSSYLGAWAADIFLGRRDLPDWGRL